MTTRRKTWMGVGLAALAGTTLPNMPSPALATGVERPHPAGVAASASADAAHLLLAQATQGGEAGGEAGEVPESYALPSSDPAAYSYEAGDEIAAYARGVEASYAASAAAAKDMAKAIDAFLAEPERRDAGRSAHGMDGSAACLSGDRGLPLLRWPHRGDRGRDQFLANERGFHRLRRRQARRWHHQPERPDLHRHAADRQPGDRRERRDPRLACHRIPALGAGSRPRWPRRPAGQRLCRRPGPQRPPPRIPKVVTDRLVSDLDRLVTAWKPGVADNYAARSWRSTGARRLGAS